MSHEINDTPKQQTAEAPQAAAQAMFRDSHPAPPSAGREAQADGQPGSKGASAVEKTNSGDKTEFSKKFDDAVGQIDKTNGIKPQGGDKGDQTAQKHLPNLELTDSQAPSKAASPEAPKAHSEASQKNLDAARQTLGDNNACAEDKLKCAHALANAGVDKVQVADKDGKMHDYRIESEKAGQNTMVHMYEKGASGKENIALRGVEHADGSVGHEKDSRGRDVAFEGASAGVGKPAAAQAEQHHSQFSQHEHENQHEHVRTHSRHGRGHHGDAQSQKPPEANRIGPKQPEAQSESRDAQPESGPKANSQEIVSQHEAKATGYYPHNDAQEGGFKDMHEKPLHTLQQYLAGKAPYVSVAMDKQAGINYGQKVNIPELNEKYGREIPFRVVDTGSAFKNKGTSRIDICTESHAAANAPSVNGKLTLQFLR